MCFGAAKDRHAEYARMFTCVVGSLPFKYLGVPVNCVRLCNRYWDNIVEKVEKKVRAY